MHNRAAVWKNELMGWASNSDPLTALHEKLKFESKEEAIKFCIAQGSASFWTLTLTLGIEFTVDEPANPHDEP